METNEEDDSTVAETRGDAKGKSEPESERRLGGLSTRALLVAVVSLALAVMLLGGLVLALKLRPAKTQPGYTSTKLSVWQKAVKENPDVPNNWSQLGLAYLEFQKPDEAKDAFEHALSLNENDPGANLQLALLIEDSQPKRAVKMLKLSAATSPIDYKVIPLVALGDLLFSQANFKDAKGAYSAAVGTDPSIFEARMGLGRSLQALGSKKPALEQYKQALRVNPGSDEAKAAIQGIGKKIPSLPTPAPTTTPAA